MNPAACLVGNFIPQCVRQRHGFRAAMPAEEHVGFGQIEVKRRVTAAG